MHQQRDARGRFLPYTSSVGDILASREGPNDSLASTQTIEDPFSAPIDPISSSNTQEEHTQEHAQEIVATKGYVEVENPDTVVTFAFPNTNQERVATLKNILQTPSLTFMVWSLKNLILFCLNLM